MKSLYLAVCALALTVLLGPVARCQQNEVWPMASVTDPSSGEQFNGSNGSTVDVTVTASFYVAVNGGQQLADYPYDGDVTYGVSGTNGEAKLGVDFEVETDNAGNGGSLTDSESVVSHVSVSDGFHDWTAYGILDLGDTLGLTLENDFHESDVGFRVYGEG